MSHSTPSDQAARDKAVDPTRSCIVQAPAGSGKTTLLVQRYLNLLCVAERPEEILAITFTRKAAAEMKQRILLALEKDDALAAAVRKRDQDANWGIRQNPNRLKVQTIDSFAMELATRLPRQESVAGLKLLDSADHLYEGACRALFEQLSSDQPSAPIIAEFLAFVHNNATNATALLTQMLARRDQWLDFNNAFALENAGSPEQIKGLLEQALADLREQVLYAAERPLSDEHKRTIQSIYAAVSSEEPEASVHSALAAVAPLLLTGKTLRKRIDKRAHPAFADKALRDRVKTLLEALAEIDITEHFQNIKHLPPSTVDPAQSELLATVSLCLSLCAVALKDIFIQEGAIDFTELQIRATSGLRDEFGPTDLALYFDYRIHHLLVDEFQDTSRSQLHFFELLTEGWQVDDSNTVFAVGDPMQSIYRFRDADVAIFAQCRDRGLGALPLEPLELVANFRSANELVEWNNVLFHQLLPNHSVPRLGAVRFSAAEAAATAASVGDVVCRGYPHLDAELTGILAHIKALQDSNTSIGVLCRSRSHLQPLLGALTAADLSWRSTDIDLLADLPVIQDLMNLYRILKDPEHRLSWFSILRSPLVGLRLVQLQRLETVRDFVVELPGFATEMPALKRLLAAVTWAKQHTFEFPLREVIEGLWLRLGSMDAYDDIALDHAMRWFDLLEELGSDAYEESVLERAVERLFANSASNARIEVMTIHKAKGLEFDHVIVPFLHRGTRHDEAPLMLWQTDGRHLLVGAKSDPIHEWLNYEDKIRAANERKRLLYVACTRARTSLWLSYQSDDPDKATGMAEWIKDLAEYVQNTNNTTSATHNPQAPLLTALSEDYHWTAPSVVTPTIGTDDVLPTDDLIGSRFEVALGHLVHKALAWLATTQTNAADLLPNRLESWSAQLDIDPTDLPGLIQQAQQHLECVSSSQHGQWLLSDHESAQCEWAISGLGHQGQARNAVIDRYFVVDQQRWIIDYKTATPNHESPSKEQFLQEQRERYGSQLERYRQLVTQLYFDDPLPIRTALYFTGLGELHEQ